MSTYPESGSPNPDKPREIFIPVPMAPKPGPIARLFTFLQWIGVAFFILVFLGLILNPGSFAGDSENKLEERYHSLNKDGAFKVAIIEVDGTIMDGDVVKKQIDKIRADDKVKALVLRVDSPGGTVTASDYIYHHVRKLVDEKKLPLVVSMGGMAASGGYYVSMACGTTENVIYAEPTTWTGSIGVIIPHFNVAGLMEKWQIEEDSIKSGPLKQVGTPTRKMKPEEKAVLQSLVDESFVRFKEIVLSGRPKLKGKDDQIAKATTGQIFTTKQAIDLGLVDKEGFIEDAIDRAIQLASLDKGSTKVVRYNRPKTLADALIGAKAPPRSVELQMLMDVTTPRVYYLFAWPGAPGLDAEAGR
jgi:protease IV